MGIDKLYEFIIIGITMAAMPGPDIIYLLTKSLLKGRKVGQKIAAGLASGLLYHTAILAIFFAIIEKYSGAFDVIMMIIKILGGIYLIYLGINGVINAKNSNFDDDIKIDENVKKVKKGGVLEKINIENRPPFIQGLIMNMINPKVTIFFLAFFPQFITWNTKNPSLEFIKLGAIFSLIAVLVFTTVATAAGKISSKIDLGKIKKRTIAYIQLVIYIIIVLMIVIY